MPSYARSQIVNPAKIGYYHCVNRCVRRAFLCGEDPMTGRSYEHRRGWIKDRLALLSEIFLIEIGQFSAMSNHIHVELKTRPDLAQYLSDEEVIAHWWKLYPRKIRGEYFAAPPPEIRQLWLNTPGFCSVRRERLASLSWFMKALCEPIARRANKEDGVTGRFWEGRFKCQALLDEKAVLAAGIYIELNPMKAKMASSLEDSEFTSIQDRIFGIKPTFLAKISLAISEFDREAPFLLMTEKDYIAVVRWHADRLVKKQHTKDSCSSDASLVNLLTALPRCPTALGSQANMRRRAQEQGKKWLKGVRLLV